MFACCSVGRVSVKHGKSKEAMLPGGAFSTNCMHLPSHSNILMCPTHLILLYFMLCERRYQKAARCYFPSLSRPLVPSVVSPNLCTMAVSTVTDTEP